MGGDQLEGAVHKLRCAMHKLKEEIDKNGKVCTKRDQIDMRRVHHCQCQWKRKCTCHGQYQCLLLNLAKLVLAWFVRPVFVAEIASVIRRFCQAGTAVNLLVTCVGFVRMGCGIRPQCVRVLHHLNSTAQRHWRYPSFLPFFLSSFLPFLPFLSSFLRTCSTSMPMPMLPHQTTNNRHTCMHAVRTTHDAMHNPIQSNL